MSQYHDASHDQHGRLAAYFRDIMSTLTHQWGFIVVRTAYAADEAVDAAQWSTALAKLRAYILQRADSAEMHPDTFALPVMADRTLLDGVSYDAVRNAFNAWVNDVEVGQDSWESDIRRDCCLVVDAPALKSLLEAPDPTTGAQRPTAESHEPWVVVLDAANPTTVPYNGGGPYLGWMRVSAAALGGLFGDLDAEAMSEICPARVYDGQIPLYDGSLRNRLVDPDGGVAGRYKFPQGTPRGVEGARVMLAEIERALGSSGPTETGSR